MAWWAVASAALGTFTLVSAEMMPVGLLTRVRDAFGVTEGRAGLLVSLPGVVAALAAPLVPLAAGRLDRRKLLALLMALMAVANVVSSLASGFAVLLASRVLVGISIGGFWAVAGGLAIRLVPPSAVPRATSVIFGGVAAATVLGVPAGTLLGELGGWRAAFAALAALSALVLAALLLLLPRLPATKPVGLAELAGQLRNRAVVVGNLATFLIVVAHFGAYTFVSPALQDLAGLAPALVGPALLGYGAAGLIGNFAGGMAAGRDVIRTLLAIGLAQAAAVLAFRAFAHTPPGGVGVLLFWGLAYGGVSVSLQTWMLRAAPQAAEAATSLWAAVFNFSIALGAFAGGIVVDRVALHAVFVASGLLFLVAVAAVGALGPRVLRTAARGAPAPGGH